MAGAEQLKALLATPELPELGPGPRRGVETEAAVSRAAEGLLSALASRPADQQLVRAVLLLWHDHLESAHKIAQDINTAEGAFVHGIMHRREPDYSNAKYWFRHVGAHEVFPVLANYVSELAQAKNQPEFAALLAPNGDWDPFAFIDSCQAAARRPDAEASRQFLRQVQAREFEALLDWFFR